MKTFLYIHFHFVSNLFKIDVIFTTLGSWIFSLYLGKLLETPGIS